MLDREKRIAQVPDAVNEFDVKRESEMPLEGIKYHHSLLHVSGWNFISKG